MGEQKKTRFAFRKLPLFLAVATSLYGVSASAQDQIEGQEQETQQAASADTAELDRITVTGSLIRRLEYDSISPVQVITAETNVAVGQISTAEFLQKSSIAAGTTQLNTTFGNFVTEGGVGAQSINLRGLGANRTLVLLNGHRPGPAGTRGQVGAFDLNVIPASVVQRIELLKDGSSSTYGSDAVAGVVNMITRRNIDRPEISIQGRLPFLYEDGGSKSNFSDGGEVFNISAATGFNFDTGSIVVAADYFKQHPLKWKDRDYLRCPRPLIRNQAGQIIDRQDVSINAGTDLEGCAPSWYSTVANAWTGEYLDPFRDANGNIYWAPEIWTNYNPADPQIGQALNSNPGIFPGWGDGYALQGLERYSLYASSSFNFGNVGWNTEALFNRRKSEQRSWRQFFPSIYAAPIGSPLRDAGYFYANNPEYVNTFTPEGFSMPIIPFPSDTDVSVDFYYINTSLDGMFSFADTWSWETSLSFSRSDGEYTGLGIDSRRSGDWDYSDDAPVINYFEPCILLGECMDRIVDAIGVRHTGRTVYDQTVFRALATGELFQMPAGAAAGAVGIEYRRFSIDDQPSDMSRNGWLWGSSSAQETKGKDNVKEIFAEIELPLLRGLPAVESLTFNGSVRAFDYDSVDESADPVWKVGLGWQIVPSLRLRATKGTSYRAPGLYELYLGDQTSFLGQTAIDPCINWERSEHPFLRANCAAAGIPGDYTGLPSSSATVFQGGGLGVLRPETSKAFTAGLIWTPSFAGFSLALDYFEYEVRDQISEIGAATILGSCYGAEAYPNQFCEMFTRNPASAPQGAFNIDEVYASYVNINRQKVSGYDLLANYERDLNIGQLSVVAELTYTKQDIYQLFDSPLAGGETISDYIGGIGRPKLVGNAVARLKRGDFTYSYGLDYVHATERLTPLSPTGPYSYAGWPNAVADTRADRRIYHSASVQWRLPNYDILLGIANLTDRKPDIISSPTATRLGNIPLNATQYDLFGRQLFGRLTYRF
jgi:iron complex outermembrane recepter protein